MEVKRRALVLLLARLVGFALGSVLLGFLAMSIGFSLLSGNIHSDWTYLVLFGALAGFILGGTAGAIGAVRLTNSWYDRQEPPES